DKPLPRFLCVLDGRELEEDEDVIWILHFSEDALNRRLLTRLRAILFEHRPPSVVVANLDPGDDERGHGRSSRVEGRDPSRDSCWAWIEEPAASDHPLE